MSNEILKLAAQEGISKRTLETAKKELGIKARVVLVPETDEMENFCW